jgi:hypothetical protein
LCDENRPSLAVDILHYEIICAVLVADIMQYTNVRMIQAGDGFCLALEALLPDRIRGELRVKNLDGYGAVQASVARTINLPQAASAERSNDLIGAEVSAWSKRHKVGVIITL